MISIDCCMSTPRAALTNDQEPDNLKPLPEAPPEAKCGIRICPSGTNYFDAVDTYPVGTTRPQSGSGTGGFTRNLDLPGRTNPARLHLPVRFGVVDDSARVEQGLTGRSESLERRNLVTHPSGIPVFERFFRSAAGIKIDKNDVRRFQEFIDEKIDDIAIAGRNSAKWNGRDVVVAQDLPITKGIQERMREFDKLEEAQEIRELLRRVVRQPPADVTFAEDTDQLLPELFGGLSVALARSFRVVDPTVSNPSTEHWDRVFTIFRLVF
ncbi:DUF1931 family protein [Mycobacterium sp. 236(2023)]|uniref:DUF1931 family protein n=1 Tax=Mycobacterium sp. 236(2023) TaxID=3038163 RepID=UPI002414E015|nr:DUF1931 family protein [Mycobacterium sp. 236(2023)]MDG4667234.1 DUF1931 family protein [Mycobacterium sp. 236(2023)]